MNFHIGKESLEQPWINCFWEGKCRTCNAPITPVNDKSEDLTNRYRLLEQKKTKERRRTRKKKFQSFARQYNSKNENVVLPWKPDEINLMSIALIFLFSFHQHKKLVAKKQVSHRYCFLLLSPSLSWNCFFCNSVIQSVHICLLFSFSLLFKSNDNNNMNTQIYDP